MNDVSSLQSSPRPRHKRAAAHPTFTSSPPPAAATNSSARLCRPPLCAGRFSGSYFSSSRPPSSAPPAAPAINSPIFSRPHFAKMLVHRYKESQKMRCSEPAPKIYEDITKQKIGIIGAGMAGLYAALILDSLGFTNYEIVEANPHRVGGRAFTHYFNGDQNGLPSAQKWNYVDLGAMRFPSITIMDRVIGVQPWSLTNYLNSHAKGDQLKIKLLDYHLSVDDNIQYYNSTRKTNTELHSGEPDPLHFGKSNGGGLDDKYVQDWYTKWLDPAFDSFKEKLLEDFDAGFRALMKHDRFSVRAYLCTFKYPQDLIDYLETLGTATGQFDEALIEIVLGSFDFDTPTKPGEDSGQWKCVEGGTSQLAFAMESIIKSKPEMNKRVVKIAPSSLSNGDIDVFVAGESEARTYHHVINTAPPPAVRSGIDTAECDFSYEKRTALRVLRVDCSVKVCLQFKYRWWQDEKVMKGKPIEGGQSTTDLPIRTIIYPSYGIDDENAAGVLMASYVWAQDAERLSALEDKKMVELALSNIAKVHGVNVGFVQEQYTGQYYIQNWGAYKYSQGAAAWFGPGQFTSLFAGLVAPEMKGRYHTAGEMASVHHAWIVGALNSAWRCVFEILEASGAAQKIQELKDKWGEVEEVDQ